MVEEWRTVEEFPNYQVSSLGRIRSIKTGKVLKITITPQGYRQIGLYIRKKQFFRKVSRLVCTAFNGSPPTDALCLHRDDNKLNDTPGNLYWGNYYQNAMDCIRNGIANTPSGERHGSRGMKR